MSVAETVDRLNGTARRLKMNDPEALKVLDCRPLSGVEKKEIRWLWKNRIPENTLTLIEGDGGRGNLPAGFFSFLLLIKLEID